MSSSFSTAAYSSPSPESLNATFPVCITKASTAIASRCARSAIETADIAFRMTSYSSLSSPQSLFS